MANTMMASEIQEDVLYAQSFKSLPNKSLYSPGGRGLGGRSSVLNYEGEGNVFGVKSMRLGEMRLGDSSLHTAFGLKAQSTTAGGAGTAGYAMIPVYVDPLVIDQTRKFTPLVEIVPRVTNRGMYADYNVITSKGGAYTGLENGDLQDTDTGYDRESTKIKYLYSVGAVTGQVQVGQPAYEIQGFMPGQTGAAQNSGFVNAAAPNARQMKVLEKTREMKELEEALIINGNATTNGVSGNIGPNGTEFDGIITLMGSTNTVDKNTTALALTDMNKAIRYAFDDGGRPNLGVCASSVYEDIENLILAKFGFMKSEEEVFWGYTTIVLRTMVGKVPIIPSMFMSNTTGSKSIYFLDLSVVEMRVLQDLTYFDLAKTNDSDRFALKIYESLIIKNTAFCASVTEIA